MATNDHSIPWTCRETHAFDAVFLWFKVNDRCLCLCWDLCERVTHKHKCLFPVQGQPPPPPAGGEGEKEGEHTEDKKQKENTAYAKKMVLRLAGLMGIGGAAGIVYIFGECSDFIL